MKIGIQKTILSLLALAALSFNSSVWAGDVTPNAYIFWDAPQTVSGDNDVSTEGGLINAFTLGGAGVPSVSVNGTMFESFAFPADSTTNTAANGNYSFNESFSANFLVSYSNLASANNPFSGLSLGYRTLLSTAGGSSYVDTLTLTITGLTVGQTYLFQFFSSNSANVNSPYSGTGLSTSAYSGGSIVLLDNTTDTDGGLGQFAIGRFVATDPTQRIDFNGGLNSQVPTLNGFQLRLVPEPSSVAMMAVGVGGLLTLLRLRRRAA